MAFIMLCLAGLTLTHPAPCKAADIMFEEAAVSFVDNYMQQWSSPNSQALAYMDKVFPDTAVYFDQPLNHIALMQAKHRFAERWPLRHFVVRDNNLSVSCNQQHLCTVWGLVDWYCRSPNRQAAVKGTSVFAFQVQDSRLVIDEDGFVIARAEILAHSASASGIASTNYSNADIPTLRKAFYGDSADRNWIADWLAAQRPFTGIARSSGQASSRDLIDNDDPEIPYAMFQSDQGPIACILEDKRPLPPSGEAIRLQGTVSIFINQTMYLSHCSFG